MMPTQIKYSMPLTSIIPVLISIFMGWLGMEMFDALRYLQCTQWTALQSAPAKVIQFTGTGRDRIYVQASDKNTYCYKAGRWISCDQPSIIPAPANARPWVMSQVQDGKPLQLIRGGPPTEVTYYTLTADGNMATCVTDFKSEVNGIIDSGAVFLLLIPIGIIIWCGVIFMKMFIRHGEPTLWDWFGRGTRIK